MAKVRIDAMLTFLCLFWEDGISKGGLWKSHDSKIRPTVSETQSAVAMMAKW